MISTLTIVEFACVERIKILKILKITLAAA
jgi:hypothetical protein